LGHSQPDNNNTYATMDVYRLDIWKTTGFTNVDAIYSQGYTNPNFTTSATLPLQHQFYNTSNTSVLSVVDTTTSPNTNASGTIGTHIGIANNSSQNIFGLSSYNDITDGTHYVENPFLEIIKINSDDSLTLLYQYITANTRQQDSDNNLPVIKLSSDGSVAMVAGRYTTRGFAVYKNGLKPSPNHYFYDNGILMNNANYQAIEMSDDGNLLFFGDSNNNEINVYLYNSNGIVSINNTYTLQSNTISQSGLTRLGAKIGLFPSSITSAYNEAGNDTFYNLISLDALTQTDANNTTDIAMDLYLSQITYSQSYSNVSFPLTHKGFTLNINNLPNNTSNLVKGDLYVDTNGFIKIKT